MRTERVRSTVAVDVSRCSTGSCAPVAGEEVIGSDKRNAADVIFYMNTGIIIISSPFPPVATREERN